jgi:putative CocE/NonD family hydrolase
MHSYRWSLPLTVVALALAVNVSARELYEVTIENDVIMKTRDGITLHADVYRPKAEGKFPVLLERTPYDKHMGVGFGLQAAARGYVYIIQDCRGRYTSGGDWYPFKFESPDGYDTVEWAAALPYANGKVGMVGGSYVGATQMLAAIAAPPHLAGILPLATGSNYHENWTYQGGALTQLFDQNWTSGLAMNTLDRRVSKEPHRTPWQMVLPLADFPVLVTGTSAGLADYYLDWLAHPRYDDYWKQWSIEEHFSKIQVLAIHVGAWYDIFQDGSLSNYLGIKAHGGNEAARNGQRLIMIVGGHAGAGPKIGDIDFGKDSVLDVSALDFRFYDYLLKGIDNGMANDRPVKIFVMGKNVWRAEGSWPLARAEQTRYYLHSMGKANTLSGDGTLSTAPPASEAADKYVYDPEDPAPTHGGPISMQGPPGPVDQRPVENREDVLVYTAPAFRQDTEVTGPISVELYVSSSAVDTDFTGKLVDVWPNGYAENLTEGILRARYRHSKEKEEFLNPGEVYKLTLDLWSTSNVFLAGHKLRLEVSSSNFPHFDRNLNTGEDPERGTRMVKATNLIYHDRDRASALLVPIVP